LEREGLLLAEGTGKRRRICLEEALQAKRLRIGILLYDKRELAQFEYRNIRRLLEDAGHVVEYGEKDLHDLRMNPVRVARFVRKKPYDAWVVNAAPRSALEWFADQPLPAFALFGTRAGLRIAGASPRKIPALRVAVRHLVELGHQRIAMLVREERRKPAPSAFAQAFLDELASLGIRTGSYNLPDWGDSPEELHRGLESLFQYTPPTALIMSEPKLFFAARDHLAQRGIVAPRDVSLICDDPDPNFTWCRPEVAHIAWSQDTIVRRVLRWAKRDGKTNPGNFVAHRKSMIRLSEIIGTLTSAYLVTKDEKYAEHAVRHLKAWFVDEATRMNPSLLYGQAIKGRHSGRSIGIIDTIHLVEVARGAKLLGASPAFDAQEQTAVRARDAERNGVYRSLHHRQSQLAQTTGCHVLGGVAGPASQPLVGCGQV